MPYYLECKYSSYKEINHKSNNMLIFFRVVYVVAKGEITSYQLWQLVLNSYY